MQLRSFLPLVLVCVTLAACDSDPGVSRLEVDGAYGITTWTFTPGTGSGGVLGTENVKARLDASASQMTFASSSSAYVLNFKILGQDGQYIISGRYSPEGSNQVEVDFGERNRDRRRVLLPPAVDFVFDKEAGTLTFNGTVSGINLEEYDASKYGGLGLTDVTGRLNIVLTRK